MKMKTTEQFIKEYYEKFPESTVEIVGEYVGANKHIKCRCKVDEYEWEACPSDLLRGTGCYQCSLRNKTVKHEDFVKRMEEINPNIEFLTKYKKNMEKIKCKCKIDGYEWNVTPNKLLLGRGCPKCGGKIVDHDEFQKITYNKYVKVLDKYEKIEKPLLCQCLINPEHKWYTMSNNLRQGTGCPICKKSKGELRVKEVLEENEIKFTPQKYFEDCKDKNPLPFDFYLDDYNIAIEYDGTQHYFPTAFFTRDEEAAKENFEYVKSHDKIKTKYCEDKGIKLIRIPYWSFNKIEEIIKSEVLGK